MSETDGEDNPTEHAETQGVIISSRNGDVLGYDETGLLLKLSDRVIADIAARLPAPARPDLGVLDDIDAWNLRHYGSHYVFTANMPHILHPRDYQRHVEGGDIYALGHDRILGFLSIGATRRADTHPTAHQFPYHLLSPQDGHFASGVDGSQKTIHTDRLECIKHATHDTLLADYYLERRKQEGRALPLILTRTETTTTQDIKAYCETPGFQNFTTLLENLKNIAAAHNARPHVLTLGIEHGLEHTKGPYDTAFLGLLEQILELFHKNHMRQPFIISLFEAGLSSMDMTTRMDLILAQARIEVVASDYNFHFSAPSYMFERDDFGRPTLEGAKKRAALEAFMLGALEARKSWFCPILSLANAHGSTITIEVQSQEPLILEDTENLADYGLRIHHPDIKITSITVKNDPLPQIILECDQPVPDGIRLSYALPEDGEKIAGSICDRWEETGPDGLKLRRYAMPAVLHVRQLGKNHDQT